jgi:site-specific recombinase XerD
MASIERLAQSFERHLKAENKASLTVAGYLTSLRLFAEFLEANSMPTEVEDLRREHVSAFIADILANRKPGTASHRFRSLRRFFNWVVEEGELAASPMAKLRQPHIPETPVPVIDEVKLRRLFASCAGKGFRQRRDVAILRLFHDAGLRRQEMANLKVVDVDFRDDVVIVWAGKGQMTRAAPFGRQTARALDRYLLARDRHPQAHLDGLWLSSAGVLTAGGIQQMVRNRGRKVGIEGLHPHQLRHTWASDWMAQGGQETDLMRLAGWKSREMLSRYGASAADRRARTAHRTYSPGDRLG